MIHIIAGHGIKCFIGEIQMRGISLLKTDIRYALCPCIAFAELLIKRCFSVLYDFIYRFTSFIVIAEKKDDAKPDHHAFAHQAVCEAEAECALRHQQTYTFQ